MGVVQKSLKFSNRGDIPGGHQEASPSAFNSDPETHPGWIGRILYEGEMIKPNEESWLPFLRKDRWLDWNNNAPVLGGGPWSIDNPLVWEALSPSLECVNRILRALIRDEHPFLKTLLFGALHRWEEVANLLSPYFALMPPPFEDTTVLLSYDLYNQYRDDCKDELSKYMEKIPSFGPDDMTQKLENLLSAQLWSFQSVF
ncbi:hypothetical protein F4859DRAFT_509507 [Xylaria cf. heliscus]|nr:hypothetical protein F4859DRAFT_509507 [Xylaria cf. heliscus]